jgi:hypothetical protein
MRNIDKNYIIIDVRIPISKHALELRRGFHPMDSIKHIYKYITKKDAKKDHHLAVMTLMLEHPEADFDVLAHMLNWIYEQIYYISLQGDGSLTGNLKYFDSSFTICRLYTKKKEEFFLFY